ncbi:methyl-accepting chemotaxis protein [Spirochaeta cellobiosiphila]|uniref:methyl-accepting chemotaxis protein n=1 Tax=Spirochaeta cellobiosiphila TaxID=504483 RepID=UPI0004032209|nr:methyl-accepting chemotaxis protein [Spirochaeta cellobiosiphila]
MILIIKLIILVFITVISVFVPHYLSVPFYFLFGCFLLLSDYYRKNNLEESLEFEDEDNQEVNNLPISDTQKDNTQWEEQITEYNRIITKNTDLINKINEVSEILINIVINKTNNAILSVTNHIFDLTKNSKENIAGIRKTLEPLINVEGDINKDVEVLNHKIDDIDHIYQTINDISSNLEVDKRLINEAVQGINQFSLDITDLADQTNLLAINASIEAARVGSLGKGFAVIATNVQTLSKKSKDIAEKIVVIIDTVNNTIDESFESLHKKVKDTSLLLGEFKNDINHIVGDLVPQINNLKTSYGHNEVIMSSISQDISTITVDLQFQDSIRQILEHVISIHKDFQRECVNIDKSFEQQKDIQREVDKIIMEMATQHFTIEEEWNAVASIGDKPIKTSSGNKEFAGNVELF